MDVDLTKDAIEEKIVFPPHFFNKAFFEEDLFVSMPRAKSFFIQGLDTEGERKVLAQDAAALTRDLEMVVVLNTRRPALLVI